MIPWLLLLLTVACAYLTYDAFRWQKAVRRGPFSIIASLWRGGLSHLSVSEQRDLQQRYSSTLFGVGEICWVFLGLTILLAVVTVRAFL